jgi:hypothetical protein
MASRKKDPLEKIADLILMDEAIKDGYLKEGTGTKHGFGRWMREQGIINAARQAEIDKHEKTGFTDDQLEDIDEFGVDANTKRRYNE